MARINTFNCEPFRAWNRLEGRPRTAEFDRVLEAGVYDALWMLTRQWQFGEFQAEDTGSAIFSKILMQSAAITRVKNANGDAQSYSDTVPLEQRVENMPFQPDYKSKLESAFMFLKYLDRLAVQLGVSGYDRKVYKARLRTLAQLDNLPAVQPGDTADQILSKSEALSNDAYVAVTNATTGRYFDGFKLYNKILANKAGTITDILNGNTAHTNLVTQAVDLFKPWMEKNYDLSGQPPKTAWVPQQLEYRFDCALPGTGQVNTVLSASEYYHGTLDWYSVDVNKNTVTGLSGAATTDEMQNLKNSLITVIPTEAKFAGAPNSRWWQFENGNVDLGNVNAGTTDIAKLVCTEYALLYNTDWLLVPYRVPVGTLCEIKGIVVTDVFGEQSFVKAAVQGQTDNWNGWGMFNLSTIEPDSLRTKPVDTRLFIPPVLVKGMESEPVEEVHFICDEMTNNVWALEVTLPDKLGGSRDGHHAARNYAALLQLWDTPPQVPASQQGAMLKYKLANTVPENWIPFIPVHVPASTRKIQLQRASMPRLFKNAYTHIRPRTQLLRHGLNDLNVQTLPYFINEEEVPRSGVQLTGVAQRTRWYNGSVVNWFGYRKQTGRGEGSSGLVYDRVEAITQ